MEIQGYPNYLIYEDGRVWSKNRKRYLKQVPHNNGYLCVCLRNDPIQNTISIHRLLAIHYIPNPHNLPFVDHIDRNKHNNKLSNLRWASALLNQQNQGKHCRNTSGHKNIHFRVGRGSWVYQYRVMGRVVMRRQFRSKIDCLCYKFICLLRQRVQ